MKLIKLHFKYRNNSEVLVNLDRVTMMFENEDHGRTEIHFGDYGVTDNSVSDFISVQESLDEIEAILK